MFDPGFAGSLPAGTLTVVEFPAGALTVVALAAEFTAGAAEFAFELAGEFAFVPVFDAVLAFASAVFALTVFAFAFVVADSPGLLESTETSPVKAGIARNSPESINTAAATIVIFDKTVAVPRGVNAELDTLLVNNAPASVLPGCNKTAATSTMQERKNKPYKK